MGDLFNAEERGKALALYSLAPLLGPALGPVCGAWYLHFNGDTQDTLLTSIPRIAERSTWRWVVRSFFILFYAISPGVY